VYCIHDCIPVRPRTLAPAAVVLHADSQPRPHWHPSLTVRVCKGEVDHTFLASLGIKDSEGHQRKTKDFKGVSVVVDRLWCAGGVNSEAAVVRVASLLLVTASEGLRSTRRVRQATGKRPPSEALH
jgi:hypothetical protein